MPWRIQVQRAIDLGRNPPGLQKHLESMSEEARRSPRASLRPPHRVTTAPRGREVCSSTLERRAGRFDEQAEASPAPLPARTKSSSSSQLSRRLASGMLSVLCDLSSVRVFGFSKAAVLKSGGVSDWYQRKRKILGPAQRSEATFGEFVESIERGESFPRWVIGETLFRTA